MPTARTLITAVCLLAVIVHPVAAAFIPCCCALPAQTKRDCCPVEPKSTEPKSTEAKSTGTKSSKPSCCAKKTPAQRVVLQPGCCCFKAAPVSTPAEDKLKVDSQRLALEMSLWVPTELDFLASSLVRHVQRVSGPPALSGPPLLALHCIWLK